MPYGATGNNASTTETSAGATYDWVIYVDDVLRNDLITAGQNTHEITWRAADDFTEINIGVTVTTAAGCECINDPPITPGDPDGGVTVTGTGHPIPTVSEWGMIIFALLLGGSALWYLRRRADCNL